jgi:CRISPR-associated protein Cas2
VSDARTGYLVCYDISHSRRRLARVRRRLLGCAVPIQYSVFLGCFTASERRDVISRLAGVIDLREDDVRLYPLPSSPIVVCRGRPVLPAGVFAALPLPLPRARFEE